jgi:hypothetical protein
MDPANKRQRHQHAGPAARGRPPRQNGVPSVPNLYSHKEALKESVADLFAFLFQSDAQARATSPRPDAAPPSPPRVQTSHACAAATPRGAPLFTRPTPTPIALVEATSADQRSRRDHPIPCPWQKCDVAHTLQAGLALRRRLAAPTATARNSLLKWRGRCDSQTAEEPTTTTAATQTSS